MVSLASFTAGRPTRRRYNLDAIGNTLRALQRAFPLVNPTLEDRRDSLGDEVVENMLAGYAMVDSLLADDVNLFAFGHLQSWLDLNTLVLCGEEVIHPTHIADLIRATEERFYDDLKGGIRAIMEWYEGASSQTVWRRAAGVYIRMVSEPQLFPEGNHRTGILIMSYLLGREGKPPIVLTPGNAKEFFDPSTRAKQLRKGTFAMIFGMRALKLQIAGFLEREASEAYLS